MYMTRGKFNRYLHVCMYVLVFCTWVVIVCFYKQQIAASGFSWIIFNRLSCSNNRNYSSKNKIMTPLPTLVLRTSTNLFNWNLLIRGKSSLKTPEP